MGSIPRLKRGEKLLIATHNAGKLAEFRELFTPLGLSHTVTLPEEAILHSAAVGHNEVEGEQVPTPVWVLPRSVGPAGLVTPEAVRPLAVAIVDGGLASANS